MRCHIRVCDCCLTKVFSVGSPIFRRKALQIILSGPLQLWSARPWLVAEMIYPGRGSINSSVLNRRVLTITGNKLATSLLFWRSSHHIVPMNSHGFEWSRCSRGWWTYRPLVSLNFYWSIVYFSSSSTQARYQDFPTMGVVWRYTMHTRMISFSGVDNGVVQDEELTFFNADDTVKYRRGLANNEYIYLQRHLRRCGKYFFWHDANGTTILYGYYSVERTRKKQPLL